MAAEQITSGFDLGDDKRFRDIGRKWNGGPFAYETFREVARLTPQAIIEVVIMREYQGSLQVLLLPRSETDPDWPGMMHSPGQALRNMDLERQDGIAVRGPFERIQSHELNIQFNSEPWLIGHLDHKGNRGGEAARIYVATIPEDAQLPEGAGWYDVTALPYNLVDHHYDFLEMSSILWESYCNQSPPITFPARRRHGNPDMQ